MGLKVQYFQKGQTSPTRYEAGGQRHVDESPARGLTPGRTVSQNYIFVTDHHN